MDMQPVSSSSIGAIGYSPESGVLRVTFRSGRTYEYFSVPEAVHRALMTASSHGRYFARCVRNVYPYRRLR